jgi:Ca2+-binding RTX toxin-like protein
MTKQIRAALVAATLTAGLGASAVAVAAAADTCEAARSGEQCGEGGGRQTAGGGEKVSHKGWPAITGVLWKVLDSRSSDWVGGSDNDELLGHHGSDDITGGPGHDVLWGDWDPKNNTTRQRDVLRGGAGNDWIYPSHGTTTVKAGPGKDYIWAFYGKGTIDCGPGKDTVRIRLNGAFKVRGCETVNHFCAYGSDGHGGCKQPGARSLGALVRDSGGG